MEGLAKIKTFLTHYNPPSDHKLFTFPPHGKCIYSLQGPPNYHLIIPSTQAQGPEYGYLNEVQLWVKRLKCNSLAMTYRPLK